MFCQTQNMCMKIKTKEEVESNIQLVIQINRHGYKNICDRLDVHGWWKIGQTIRVFIVNELKEERESERDDDDKRANKL